MPVPGPVTLRVLLSSADIAANDITLDKLTTVNTNTILGRATAGIGDIESLTAAQARLILNVEDGSTADQTDAEIETGYNNQVPQVSAGEKTAGTETAIRRFSPLDIADMAGTHGGGGGGSSDHGTLTGLADDDHTQYLLADGTRTLSGNLTVTGTVDGRDVAVDGAKLDGIAAGAEVNPDVVSQAEAEAGVATTERIWTAQRVAQAIAALGGGGGVTDHGALTGLSDDDHTQYLLADGTRSLTGNLTVSALATIDGRDLSVDGAKLDGISANADVTQTVLGTVTGDVTFTALAASIAAGAVGTPEVADNAITAAKLEDIPSQRFLGRDTVGSGDPESLDMATARTMLNVEDGATADQSDAEIETAYNNQVSVVSQAEAEAGTSTTPRRWTAQRVAQAIAALETGGGGGGTDVSVLAVKKASAGTITKGQVVYAAGYDSGVTVELSDADSDPTIPPIGVANESIDNSTGGDIVTNGIVSGFDTSAFTAGDVVYLNTTAGGLTATRPDLDIIYEVGTVLYSHATLGILAVNIREVVNYEIIQASLGYTAGGDGSVTNEVSGRGCGFVCKRPLKVVDTWYRCGNQTLYSSSDATNYWTIHIYKLDANGSNSAPTTEMNATPLQTDDASFSGVTLRAEEANFPVDQNQTCSAGDFVFLDFTQTGSAPSIGFITAQWTVKVRYT